MRIKDEIDAFRYYNDLTDLSIEQRRSLISILESKFPLEVISINKLRTRKYITDHHEYMRLARMLYDSGYIKQGIWFIFPERRAKNKT